MEILSCHRDKLHYQWQCKHDFSRDKYYECFCSVNFIVPMASENMIYFILFSFVLFLFPFLVDMATITKTRLFKYIENFSSKNLKFSDKKQTVIFFILLLKT